MSKLSAGLISTQGIRVPHGSVHAGLHNPVAPELVLEAHNLHIAGILEKCHDILPAIGVDLHEQSPSAPQEATAQSNQRPVEQEGISRCKKGDIGLEIHHAALERGALRPMDVRGVGHNQIERG